MTHTQWNSLPIGLFWLVLVKQLLKHFIKKSFVCNTNEWLSEWMIEWMNDWMLHLQMFTGNSEASCHIPPMLFNLCREGSKMINSGIHSFRRILPATWDHSKLTLLWIPGLRHSLGNCIVYELARASTELAICDMIQGIRISIALVFLREGSISLVAGGLGRYRTASLLSM